MGEILLDSHLIDFEPKMLTHKSLSLKSPSSSWLMSFPQRDFLLLILSAHHLLSTVRHPNMKMRTKRPKFKHSAYVRHACVVIRVRWIPKCTHCTVRNTVPMCTFRKHLTHKCNVHVGCTHRQRLMGLGQWTTAWRYCVSLQLWSGSPARTPDLLFTHKHIALSYAVLEMNSNRHTLNVKTLFVSLHTHACV